MAGLNETNNAIRNDNCPQIIPRNPVKNKKYTTNKIASFRIKPKTENIAA